MTSHHGTHNDLHSEQGALSGEHAGRARNPVIKVLDLAWLEFVKPDLAASERFAHAFGFTTVGRTADELLLRGTDAGAPAVVVRRGPHSRYLGAAFRAVVSAAQKQFLRMGPQNVHTVQAKLREIAAYAGIPETRLPPAKK